LLRQELIGIVYCLLSSAGAAGVSLVSPWPGAAGCSSWIGPEDVSAKGFSAVSCTGIDETTESLLIEKTARVREVNINAIAAPVVSLLKKVAAPLLPNSVWLEPPKAAPISAPLLLWISIIKIRNRQTIK